MSARAVIAVAVFLLAAGSAFGQSSKKFFKELRDAGGVHPFAELVCFPAGGQGLDSTFFLAAFSKNVASTLRAKGREVPQEFIEAEKAPEKDRFLLQWAFRDGVAPHKQPEILEAVPGTGGMIWDSAVQSEEAGKKVKLRVIFTVAGGYSRDILIDGTTAKSIYGRCEAID